MTSQKIWKGIVLPLLILFVFAAVLFWVVHESWESAAVSTDAVTRSGMTETVGGEAEAVQRITVAADVLKGIRLDLYVQDPAKEGTVCISLLDGTEVLCTGQKAYAELVRDGMNEFLFAVPLTGRKGSSAELHIRTDGGIWFGYGNTVSAGKMEIAAQTESNLYAGNEEINGSLVMSQSGADHLTATSKYWPAVLILAAAWIVIFAVGERVRRRGTNGLIWKIQEVARRYRYLLKQLIMRDFKVKYKASMLGVLWSFLNPLLMTLVYFLVFSNLFTNQEHFVVYLMTGTVLFNYVSEATSLGLGAIVGNVGLITKVYVPKYIYPVSRVLSSSINLLISMIPLLFLMVLNRLPFTKAILLIPVLVALLVVFCTGLSLILSALMVFFRDMQFLWSVLILMWNFLSPVFYPESIIPASFRGIYRMNPLYQYMSFMRSITLNGAAPGPDCFRFCLLASLISLILGCLVFRKLQPKFAIYL
ncbi:MAG: ABC transporter permease [Clostridia bacterium]|nr:ABC transporter permease [Clostridia bacterium]